MSEEFTVVQAAAYAGISKEGVRGAVEAGRLQKMPGTGTARFSRDAVELFCLLSRERLMASFAARGDTPVSLGRMVHKRLHPVRPVMPVRGEVVLAALPLEVRRFFGKSAMAAACVREGCRWCEAVKFARFGGERLPEYDAPGLVALFGETEPCTACGPGLFRPLMDGLAARVHRPGARPPEARTVAAAAPRPSAAGKPVQRAVTAAAQPMQGGDGAEFREARRKQLSGRLRLAQRDGDKAYAGQLLRQLKAL